ncbi:unnamed protein product [Ceutorhynchus assimilis]|uniref:Gustatory receptor n=1 Tax=Ceutorhynchus assimilis TaxID=467358 RepID=A0A9N9MMJ0_9CUCU|nr:unnamed protein product [Ceutorhynchus assimilis]
MSATLDTQTTFYILVRNAFYVIFCVSTLMQVAMGHCAKYSTARWLNSLATSDAAMEKLGLLTNCRTLKKSIAYLISLGVFLFVAKVVIYQQAFEKPWIIVICVAVYHITKSTLKMGFVFFMLHLHLRFQMINTAIDEFASRNQRLSLVVPGLTFYDHSVAEKFNSICKMHFRLSYLAKRLNDIASFQLFFSFFVSLGALLLFSFYLYHYIKTMSSENLGYSYKAISTFLFGIIGLIDEIFDCLLITKSCGLLCKSSNSLTNQICKTNPTHTYPKRYIQWKINLKSSPGQLPDVLPDPLTPVSMENPEMLQPQLEMSDLELERSDVENNLSDPESKILDAANEPPEISDADALAENFSLSDAESAETQVPVPASVRPRRQQKRPQYLQEYQSDIDISD